MPRAPRVDQSHSPTTTSPAKPTTLKSERQPWPCPSTIAMTSRGVNTAPNVTPVLKTLLAKACDSRGKRRRTTPTATGQLKASAEPSTARQIWRPSSEVAKPVAKPAPDQTSSAPA